MPKSWTEKFDYAKPHELKTCPKDMMGMKAGQRMLIPSPKLIDTYVRAIPEGEAVDIPTMRADLAAAQGADVTCPLTTGIFLRIVAEAAAEARNGGAPVAAIAPVWRVLDAQAKVTKKLDAGTAFITDQRAAEGLPA